MLGAGVQAYWQLKALYGQRHFKTLLVWARNLSKAEGLRTRLLDQLPNVEIRATTDLVETVKRADVLITATGAREPLVRGEWLRAGQHITAVGADDPTKCELDAEALNRAKVFVDSIETCASNGDLYRAIQQEDYAAQKVSAEIGEVLAGRKAGRASEGEITIAKFVGLGAQDLVAAETALRLLGIAA